MFRVFISLGFCFLSLFSFVSFVESPHIGSPRRRFARDDKGSSSSEFCDDGGDKKRGRRRHKERRRDFFRKKNDVFDDAFSGVLYTSRKRGKSG